MGKLIRISETNHSQIERRRKLDNTGKQNIGKILIYTGVRYEYDEEVGINLNNTQPVKPNSKIG